MRKGGARLYRRYRQGEVAQPGFADDYAFMVWGLVDLYEATLDLSYLEEAIRLNQVMLELFWDDDYGGVFFTGREHERLIARTKEIYDGAVPSSNSVAALNLIRLGRTTGAPDLTDRAMQVARAFAKRIRAYPSAYTQFLAALEFMIGPGQEIVVVGGPRGERTSASALVKAVHRAFLPNKVLLLRPESEPDERLARLAPLAKDLSGGEGGPAVYVCEGPLCGKRLTTVSELEGALMGAGAARLGMEAPAG
jgi:uncharacterized protein YyaL (SSP411 family)